MAEPLILHSERYQLEGGAGGDAARRALGRPRLDHLSVLVRESVQNSWDARRNPEKVSSSIEFTARLEAVKKDEFKALQHRVFRDHPKDHPLFEQLRPELTRLVFEDRGTVGLGGPVFKTARNQTDEPRNFVRFFRDIGRDVYAPAGGGTYGYGKSVLFNASAAATVIVHTRFESLRGTKHERLMAMSLWHASKDETHTGRHWWGVRDADHPRSIAPASGAMARDLAQEIGFNGFERETTGTSIMILAPQLGEGLDADHTLAAKCIAETMVLWYWPRMLGGGDGTGRIKFKMFLNDQKIIIPDPESTPPFKIYSAALHNLVQRRTKQKEPAEPNTVREIRSERPKARLGWLSLSLTTHQHREDWAVTAIGDHPLAEQLKDDATAAAHSNHVALMRDPGQVIRYLSTRSYPDPRLEYAGVFLLDTDSDEARKEFIESEPPSHDDWRPQFLGMNARSFVKIGLNRIRAECERFTDAGRGTIESPNQDPLGAMSADLGVLLSATTGTGARPGGGRTRPGAGGGGGGGGGRSNGITLIGDGRLEQRAGGRVFILPFRIEGDIPSKGARVSAYPRVIIAGGGIERDAPAEAMMPKVVGWHRRSGEGDLVRTSELKVKSPKHDEWEVIVTVPSDAMIGVSLECDSAQD